MSCDTIVPQLIFSAGSPAIFLLLPMDDHPGLIPLAFRQHGMVEPHIKEPFPVPYGIAIL